jgi:hypothetical protein
MPKIPELGTVGSRGRTGYQKATQPYSDLLKRAVTEISANINK